MNTVSKWLTALLNPTDSVSFGRVMSLILVAFTLGFDTAMLVFAWKFNSHLPAGAKSLPFLPDAATIAAQTGFVTAFYGATKLGEIMKKSDS